MIFTLIINGFFTIIKGLLAIAPGIPTTGIFQSQALFSATDYIMASAGLIDIVVPIGLIQTIIISMITLYIFKLMWSIIMFVLKKVPLAAID